MEVQFQSKIELVENAHGISVKKGPLLYSLKIDEKKVINGYRELNNCSFPHYSLYPNSKWNYAIQKDSKPIFNEGLLLNKPWTSNSNSMSINIEAFEIKNYTLLRVNHLKKRNLPRGPLYEVNKNAVFTPAVPKKITKDRIKCKTNITLVPYCTTRLRIAIFPLIKDI